MLECIDNVRELCLGVSHFCFCFSNTSKILSHYELFTQYKKNGMLCVYMSRNQFYRILLLPLLVLVLLLLLLLPISCPLDSNVFYFFLLFFFFYLFSRSRMRVFVCVCVAVAACVCVRTVVFNHNIFDTDARTRGTCVCVRLNSS